jgi:hypothetical protein
MLHLSTSGFFGIVFEHFQDYFHPKNLANGFPQLFQLCFYIAQGHIPPQIAHVLKVAHLLAMTKPLSGVCPIAMGEALYRLTSRTLCFQFREAFVTHFAPHQFGITNKGSYEIIFHGIRCILDLHPNWVIFFN